MKAAVIDNFGEPADVLQVRDVPISEPGKNEVRVRMRAAPINPSDMLTVRGSYGRAPALPATPGFEGAGVIDAVGPGLIKIVRGLRPGRRVAVISVNGGTWAETVVVSARHVVPVPDDVPDDQAASFFVNPATVLVMVKRVLKVGRGDWLVQTAAASSLGRMVIRLGKYLGFRTINVVRRQEQAAELMQLGADAVIATEKEEIDKRVSELTRGEGVRFAIDAVGGAMGQGALRSLGAGGRLLVYGALSGEPIPVEPRQLIGGQKRIEGFWLSEWAKAQGPLTMLALFRDIIRHMRAGVLTTPLEAAFPLEQIKDAARAAERTGRRGKVLLRMGAP